LERIVRNRDAITIEKSADALDEVQHAAERELAIRNLDRESNLLRTSGQRFAALKMVLSAHACIAKEEISPKRIAR